MSTSEELDRLQQARWDAQDQMEHVQLGKIACKVGKYLFGITGVADVTLSVVGTFRPAYFGEAILAGLASYACHRLGQRAEGHELSLELTVVDSEAQIDEMIGLNSSEDEDLSD